MLAVKKASHRVQMKSELIKGLFFRCIAHPFDVTMNAI